MTSPRVRSNKSIGKMVAQAGKNATKAAKTGPAPAANSVTAPILAPNSVTPTALATNSVTSDALAAGAVGTHNLGIINNISSDSILALSTPETVALLGPSYAAPTAGKFYNLLMDSSNNIQANTTTTQTRHGVLDPLYTDGPAYVTFNGDSVQSGPFNWVGTYTPVQGQTVVLTRNMDGSYTILGPETTSITFPNQITLPFLNGTTQYPSPYDTPSFSKTLSGIVVVKGMLNSGSVTGVTAGTVIATLPAGFTPDTYLDFPIEWDNGGGNGTSWATVRPDGTIRLGVTIPSGAVWYSLSGIKFPAAGVATWTPVQPQGTTVSAGTNAAVFQNGFVDGGNANYGACAWWKDSYGFVWWRGQISTGTASLAAATAMMYHDASIHVLLQQHFMSTTSTGAFSYIGTLPLATLPSGFATGTNVGTTVGLLQSLAPVVYPGGSDPGLTSISSFVDSWVNFDTGTTYARAAYYKRTDKLVCLQGLIKSGTLATGAFTLPAGLRPSAESVASAVSNAAIGRLDVQGAGGVVPNAGSNTWFSLDGHVFIAED